MSHCAPIHDHAHLARPLEGLILYKPCGHVAPRAGGASRKTVHEHEQELARIIRIRECWNVDETPLDLGHVPESDRAEIPRR